MQTLKKALDETNCADLEIELGRILGGLPGQGYLIIGDLPDGSRLSHGHDNRDRTWTLMFDEVAGLKFLPGPVRGVISLKAEIFTFGAGTAHAQRTRRIPLILHTDDGIPCGSEQDLSPLQRRYSRNSAPRLVIPLSLRLRIPRSMTMLHQTRAPQLLLTRIRKTTGVNVEV